MVAQNVIFGVIAVAMGIAAIRVVTTQNIVHAALYLVVVLAGVAAVYILLAAEFTAVAQILVYVGAILVLFLFGIMLTRAPIGRTSDLDNDQRWLALAVSLLLLGVLAGVLADAFEDTKLPADAAVQRSGEVGTSIFQVYVIPFEVISVLLLAALVGAVVIARRD
ncbi:MAG TPA: NADH-quinone oxidoreductase subunit J [Acidimicrobiales bacterium]|jgi:NADH-quinone oxidoreductase subunit J|nr:NADH-quinone oxidoreductase subunit J [Acidimicrobiales bacterium]